MFVFVSLHFHYFIVRLGFDFIIILIDGVCSLKICLLTKTRNTKKSCNCKWKQDLTMHFFSIL